MTGRYGSPAQVKTRADLREGCPGGYRSLVTALPKPRGALSVALQSALRDLPVNPAPRLDLAPESRDDAALSLWMLHELSYGGFDDIDDAAEDEPEIGRVRRRLEQDLEASLRERWPGVPDGVDLASGFFDWVAEDDGPSLARHVQTEATHEQVLDLLRVRSVYHLKEADPTTWVIPRLPTAAKAALGGAAVRRVRRGRPGPAALPPVGPRHGGQRVAPGVRRLRQRGTARDPGAEQRGVDVRAPASAPGSGGRAPGGVRGHQLAPVPADGPGARPARVPDGDDRLLHRAHRGRRGARTGRAPRRVCGAGEEEPSLAADVWFGAWACLELESRTARALLDLWGVAA